MNSTHLLPTLLLIGTATFGLAQNTISVIDFVQIKDGKQKETLYYYENNWKVYRDIAVKKGYISAYRLMTTTADSTANFDLILITEYADSLQFKSREARFQQIIKEVNPNGPKFLNDLRANDFREIVFSKEASTLFCADKKRKKRR
jgi:hypothetical protein